MKNSILFFILIFLTSHTAATAQNQVYGILQDSLLQPIDFGEIHLTQKNTENTFHTYSNTKGEFKFDDIPTALYQLRISFLGTLYQEREIYIDKNTDLGVITVDNQSELSEIVIEGRKKTFETKIDRTVFNVENSIIASSGTALDALKVTPGLQVSNDNIKIIGKNSISVMINDKLIQMSGEDLNNYLKTLNASDIEKIEVITTPPAKYDAQGDAGLVNIVLKGKREDAWNNSTRINYFQGSFANYRFGNTFTYSKNKLSLLANVDASNGNHFNQLKISNYYPDETWMSTDLNKNSSKLFSGKINIDYQVTPKSALGFQYMKNKSKGELIWTRSQSLIFDANQQLLSKISTDGENPQQDQFDNFNFNYDYKIDTLGKKVTLNIDYFSTDKENFRPFESNRVFYSTNQAPENVKATISGDMNIDIYSAKLDFEHPLKSTKLEYGAKVNWVTSLSDSKYFNRDTGETIQDLSKSDQFKYEERVQALYASISKEWSPKWSSQFGMRMEATQTKGDSYSVEQTNKREFTNFFPTAYLQYKPTENHNFNLNYNKRFSRPRFSMLNPFRWYLDAYTYIQGNPFLEPFNTHKVELSYTYKNNWNTRLSISQTDNLITQVQNIDEINKTRIFTQENFYSTNSYSIYQNYTFSKYAWWQSINTLVVATIESTFNDNNKIQYEIQNGVNGYFYSNNSFKINPKLTFEVNGYFHTKSYQTMFIINPSASLNLGLGYKMMDNKLNVTFNIQDILRTQANKIYAWSEGTKIIYNNYYDNRFANLSVTYNFGNKNIQAKRVQTGNEEERNRS